MAGSWNINGRRSALRRGMRTGRLQNIADWSDERQDQLYRPERHHGRHGRDTSQYEQRGHRERGSRDDRAVVGRDDLDIRADRHDTGGQGNRQLTLRPRFLEELLQRDAANIVMTLAHTNTKFRQGLIECSGNPDMLRAMLSVLSKAFKCSSMPEQFDRMFMIIKECRFFDSSMTYFLDMQTEESVHIQQTFKQPIKDMIIIMEELSVKKPTAVTQFIGVHAVLKIVIDYLDENTYNVIDDDILRSFRDYTEHRDRLLNPGVRHRTKQREEDIDEPPDNFREIQIFPQKADMQPNNDRCLRGNKVKGRYKDLEHYLDVQFRLLREDFVAPLREGISDYIDVTQERGQRKCRIQDVRIYDNVRLISPDCGENGLCHVLQFDVSKLGHVRWNSTKRLIYGSLLCLSSDNFTTFFFATVMNREQRQVEKGLVTVHFEHDHQTVRTLFGQVFTMAETTAYFESYRHVLKGIQRTRPGDLPFERYIVQCESKVRAPAYIRRNLDTTFDLRPLADENIVLSDDIRLGENIGEIEMADLNYKFTDHLEPARKVSLLNSSTWPTADLLHLDSSQYTAIHTALTKEFVIIQGPPGTGKTYIGLKIVKALLHNKGAWSKHPDTGAEDRRPMLIVCYTNHALDQFLEGITQFYKGDVLRVGGRSNSEILKELNLNNFRQRFRNEHKIPIAVYQGRKEAKNEMNFVVSEINQVSAEIQVAATNILHEDFLRLYMGGHYLLLKKQYDIMLQVYPEARQFVGKNHSIIVEWLELGNLATFVKLEGNMTQSTGEQIVPERKEKEDLIDVGDVEDEVDAMQAHRKIDAGFNADCDIDFIVDMVMGADNELTKKASNELKIRLAVSEQQKYIALNLENIDEHQRNVKEGVYQSRKKTQQKLKFEVQKNLGLADSMSDEEAVALTDMWKMPLRDKWRLYRTWVQKHCESLIQQIGKKEEEFEAAAARYREALMQEDKEIMRHSTVIGMTTTGAARYQAVLQEIGPRVIVVEEAAEVLEAHIMTTLSRGCEHLILIGDHKQLKPNPTVYNLATDYNLDLSLFERMITNGIKFDCLEIQHRMRPEIAELMHHIYENLKDHYDVKRYEKIRGISQSIFFIDHRNEETHDEDLKSHSNKYEAEYIVALCRYLILQGYKKQQITILTLYSGQLFCLRRMMPKDEFDGVRLTVVDNYQGEENDIILLSLVRSNKEGNIGFLKIENRVCVALSRAKKGFYAIGNFEVLRNKSKLWNEIVIDMKSKKRLGEGLILYCQNHPDDDSIIAKLPSDFMKATEGGCNRKCNFRLECGHLCEMYCHVIDREHKEYICRKKCEKVICENGHQCRKSCANTCGPCMDNIAKEIPKCGHIQQVPCSVNPVVFQCRATCEEKLVCGHLCQSECGQPHTQNCNIIIDKIWPCGHKGRIKCYQKDEALCSEQCNAVLDCEHQCQGTCSKCFQGRLHLPCRNDCIRILVCGHECGSTCNQCPPCTRKCENRCQHSVCNKGCGELCVPCLEPCEWQCEHYSCGRLCSEPCDRPRCDQPCLKTLPCEHQCIGLCGEPCPSVCRICDKEKVTEIFFGDEDEPLARFVLLEDCRSRCIIESAAMDNYMDMRDDRDEIKLKECPKCKTPIRKSNRYRQIINKTLQEIEAVKRIVLVSKDRIRTLEKKIKESIEEEDKADIRFKMKRRLNAMSEPKSENALAAMLNQLTLLKHLTRVEEHWRGLNETFDKDKALDFLQKFREWLLVERTIMTPQETNDAELELSRSKAHLKLLLHLQMARSLGKTIDYKLQSKVLEAEELIKGNMKYAERIRIIVEDCLTQLKDAFPLSGLGVSEDERVMIVRAMSLPKGHWFTCPEGHVYAIANCGGAVIEANCPECGSTIGGTGHRLRDDNRFFGGMDSAQHPAWSEQANLGNYGFDVQF